jgi:predicted TIM-barrel fold metal-dependent hydrolase
MKLPSRAADCHLHVFDPDRFPYDPQASPRPLKDGGTPTQFRAVMDSHGITHALLVSPWTGYRFDNRCTIDAVRRSGGRFRGIARPSPQVSDKGLRQLKKAGMLGIRIDLLTDGMPVLAGPDGPRLLARIHDQGLLVQIQPEKDLLAEIAPILRESPVQIVIDHCGRPDPAKGLNQPGFKALLQLADTGRVAVKLSGPFRFSHQPFPYSDADPYPRALLRAFGAENCVWGSDWPFVLLDSRIDYGPCLDALERWAPKEADRRRILWDTPKRLFGFASR